jgi:glycolate dehydrogenase FAD-linked subunit
VKTQAHSQKDRQLDTQLIFALEQLLGQNRCLSCPEDLLAYSFDMFARGLPELVVLPETTREVSQILKLANQFKTAVTPRGAGTSLTGGPVPVSGGIVLAMTRMNKILEISTVDRFIRVQPGVVTKDLQTKANDCGLYYPPNPTSADYCTIGGNIATNAGGASGVKYGVTANYILGLTLVLADGRVLETGGTCIKSVSGFDFKRAFCGSEGLLGVITQACLRLIPLPRAVQTSLAYFDTIEQAADTVALIIERGLVPSTMELMDKGFLEAVSRVYNIEFPEKAGAGLLIEFDDPQEILPRLTAQFEQICHARALTVTSAKNQAERDILWQARKGGTAALVRNAKFLQTLDFCVPVSRIAEGIRGLQKITRNHDLKMVLIGHAGDGNLHPMFIYDPQDPVQTKAFALAEEEMCRFILSLEGTLSGEHGIGIEKAVNLPWELSAVEMNLGRQLKSLLDPNHILNPGKCGF